MLTNRIAKYAMYKPTSIVTVSGVPSGFVVLPTFFTGGANAQAAAARELLYRMAYEKAQQAARATFWHRRLFSVWN